MPYDRGDVVRGQDLLGGRPGRPHLVLTDDDHPFHDQEFMAAVITKTQRPIAIELPPSEFASGGLPHQSFAAPWNVVTLKNNVVTRKEGELEPSLVDTVAEEAAAYLGVSP